MKLARVAVSIASTCLAVSSAACGSTDSKADVGDASSDGSGGPGGVACKNVAICQVLPLAQVNSTLAASFTSTVPDSTASPGGAYSDECDYLKNGSGLKIVRICYPEEATARTAYESAHMGFLPQTGARTDLTGVGDGAFFDDLPGSSHDNDEAKLFAFEGNVTLSFDEGAVPAGRNLQQPFATLAKLIFAR